MSRFYGSMDNRRGHQTTACGLDSGQSGHLRGWSTGVNVRAYPLTEDKGRDAFDVTMTSGSNGGGASVHLGTVVQTANGPKWDPRDVAPEHILHPNTLNTFVRTIADMDPDADDAQETVASLIGWAKSLVSEGAVPLAPGA